MNRSLDAPIRRAVSLTAALGIALMSLAGVSQAEQKTKITKQDDLPRHEYTIDAPVEELLAGADGIEPLADQLRADIEADLEKYDIEDKTTLKSMYSTLSMIYSMRRDYDKALQYSDLGRQLEDKEAARLLSGTGLRARAKAFQEVGDMTSDAFKQAFYENYRANLEALPYDVVADNLQQSKGHLEYLSENLMLGMVRERVQPAVDAASGSVTQSIAGQIVGLHATIHMTLPIKDQLLLAMSEIIDVNKEVKEDIWMARSVDLTGHEGLTPLRVAIWDTGVDVDIFGDRAFVNPNEKPDGEDNDGNGFVDDVNGIAYDVAAVKTTGNLYPMDNAIRPVAELQDRAKGFFDLQAALDTEEASAVKQEMSSLQPEEVRPFLEDLTRYTLLAHGTHVAGIALDGNPAASVLVARLTAEETMVPRVPTMEEAENAAAMYRDVIDYFKQHDVRVVNMSWVSTRSSIESALEQNGVGENAEERKKMAREMFDVGRDALYEAMKGAPEIFFVGGAGNSNNDIQFDEFYPPMFDLPNLMIAGAVDQAGEPTSFTSFGASVNIYSNGHEVESYVPGGDRLAFSGTSMASPNVANLAAKLIALEPSLDPTQVRGLILEGADEHVEGEHVLKIMNPKRSVKLLEERRAGASM